MARYVSPSLLAADFGNLEKEITLINHSNAGWLHCDVMDGVFVPNISFGMPVIEMASRISAKPLDVHIMIVEPDKYIDWFCSHGIDILTLHLEACRHLNRAIAQIKEHRVKAGISLNPHTPVEGLSEIISEVDIVLIMSVNPGFGGQKFIENTYNKVTAVQKMIKESGSHALIQVDGGIDMSNAGKLYAHGVDILVAGTSVFHSDNPAQSVDNLLIKLLPGTEILLLSFFTNNRIADRDFIFLQCLWG
jgi:ribulose-phosphate 3-epimerase